MKFAWIFPALLLFSLSSALALDAGEELQFFQKLHEDGLHEVALREMESSLSKNPGHELSHEIHHLASLSALALGELEKLSRHLQRFADLRPEDPRLCDLLFQSARECAREGRFELADPLIERLLREHPDCEEKGEVVYLSARIRHAQGNRPAALQLLAWIVENSSDSELLGKALYERADLRGEDNPQSAALDLEALKGSLPNHPLAGFASLRLAGIRHSQGETGKALDEIDWILSRFDEKELVLRALQRKADYLEEYGHLKEAASALGELQLRFPGRADSQVQAMREAELLLSAADPRKALLILGKAIRTHGSSSSLWILQSRTLDSLGKEGEAEASWRKSLELDLNGEQKRETLLALCETVFEDDPGSEYPVFHSDLFPLLDSARERSQSLLRLGLYFRNRDENMPALQAWELLEKEKSRASEYQESLYYRALLLAELERGAEGDFLLMKLQEEYGGSHWGLQARDHLESVARYERVLKEAAVEELVDILRSESKLSVAASLRLGRVFSEQLKDFPRAVAHFEALSESLEDLDESAHAAYEAGRVSALQSRKLVLAGDEKTALQWRERALEFFRWASRSSRPETLEGSDYERTLLELDRLEQGPEQMPFLDLYLESWPASPRSALLLSRRAEILLEQQSGDIEEERILAVLEDCRRSLTLDSSGAAAPATRLTLARASRKLNRMEDAEIQYRILLDQFSTRYEGVEARYGLGELAEKRKEFRTALTLFGEYESMAPGSSRIPRCLIHLGDCHFFLRNWEKARDYYRRIREEYPDNPFVDDTVFRSALAAERMGEGDAQRKDLVWLSQNGEERFRREALWRLAALPTEASSRQGVLQELLKLGWSGRYSEESAIELARGALDSGQGKEALALCDSLLTRTDSGENLPLLRSLRIRSLLQLDRGEEALAIWESVEDASPLAEV